MAFCAIPSTRNFGHLINHRAGELDLGNYDQCFFWKFDDLQISQDIGGEAIVAFCRDPNDNNYHPHDSGRLIVFEVMQVLVDVEGLDERQSAPGFCSVLTFNDAVRNIFKQNTPRIAKLLGDLKPWQTLGDEGAALLSRLAAQSIVDQQRLANEAFQAVMDQDALAAAEELGFGK